MEEWKEYKLGDIVSLVIDYRGKTPLKLGGSWSESGYRALSAKNIKTGKIINEESIRFIDEDLYKKWMKDEVQRGDILITSEAPFGQIFYWDSDEKIVLSQRLFCIRTKTDVFSKFLFYYMTTHQFQNELDGRATGTTVVGLRQPELMKCTIRLPSYDSQIKISNILSSIDEKIENNRKINENLEQQALALFKSWFVDFEPFRDQPFVDSELGPIPQGWRVGRLEEICEIIGGGTPSKNRDDFYTNKGIAWLTPKDLSMTHAKFTSRGENDITKLGYENSSAKLMPKGSVLFSSRAPIGYITIAQNEICTNQGFKSAVPKIAGTAFLYFFLKRSIPTIESKATGSTFKEASGSLMKSLDIVIPTNDIFDKFEALANPFFKLQEAAECESHKLAKLRDTLLPKLMSGEIKV